MKRNWFLCLTVLFVDLGVEAQSSELASTLISYERLLYDYRTNLLDYYRDCTLDCKTSGCAIDACMSSFTSHPDSGLKLTNVFGPDKTCGNCSKTDRSVDFKRSSVLNADKKYQKAQDAEYDDLLCWTSALDKHWAKNADIEHMSWQYFGTTRGMHRSFPGTPQQECATYDPRLRPWYIAATTGPKNIVFVLDTSGSMSQHNRLQIAINATTLILNCLTILDRFSIVQFDSSVQVIPETPENELLRGTAENVKKAKDALQNIAAMGNTHMEDAFDKAFELLEKGEKTTTCHKVIMFMTDGDPSDGKDGLLLENHITSLNKELQAAIFTFSLGEEASNELPRNIACQNGGVWTPIKDDPIKDDPKSIRTHLSPYFDYIAMLRDPDTKVAWVEPYDDAFGAGKMTTASLAVYDKKASPPTLLGVLGMDIGISAMQKLEPDPKEILNSFIRRSIRKCPPNSRLEECLMENIRRNDPELKDLRTCARGKSASLHRECNITSTNSICEGAGRQLNWCKKRVDYQSDTCTAVCNSGAPRTIMITLSLWISLCLVFLYLY